MDPTAWAASLARARTPCIACTHGLHGLQGLHGLLAQVLAAFRELWANHANVVGDQINGLGSMGAGPVRKGRQNLLHRLAKLYLHCEVRTAWCSGPARSL